MVAEVSPVQTAKVENPSLVSDNGLIKEGMTLTEAYKDESLVSIFSFADKDRDGVISRAEVELYNIPQEVRNNPVQNTPKKTVVQNTADIKDNPEFVGEGKIFCGGLLGVIGAIFSYFSFTGIKSTMDVIKNHKLAGYDPLGVADALRAKSDLKSLMKWNVPISLIAFGVGAYLLYKGFKERYDKTHSIM